jgi:large subunit ribosomal protein L30
MFAIIRVRGPVKINRDIEFSMQLLNLTRANHCVLYPENEKIKGMINKARGYVTWGEISNELLVKLLAKRGKAYNKEGKLQKLKATLSEEEIAKLATNLLEGKTTIKNESMKPVFRLKPPSKGYDRKGIKKTFNEGGALGYRAANINVLLKKML